MRRSGLETVRRVAELRETGARTAVAAARRAHEQAERAATERSALLAGTSLPGGRALDVVAAAETRSRLAAASTEARRDAVEALRTHEGALLGWAAAHRRVSVLDEALERQRAEAETDRERAFQRVLDDLAVRGRTT